MELLKWDVYEILADSHSLIGVSMRGGLRKFATTCGINLLVENAADKENCVRFAVLSGQGDDASLQEFILRKAPSAATKLVLTEIINPVLSKLSIVILEDKY